MNAPHWLQTPRRPGFGAGLSDFQAYFNSDANFAGAWSDIQTQLTHEGADESQINLAKTALTNSFEQLAANLGVSGDDAVTAAHQFVTMGQTVVGAASTVSGLIQTATSGSAPQITQAFTGVMVSLAISSGAVSAGIGAAIVGGVGLILNALGSLGLFGQGGGTNVCGATVNPPPDLIVGCMPIWSTNPQQQPGTIGWRSFPIEGVDTTWFVKATGYTAASNYTEYGPGVVTWRGLTGDYFTGRAIDYAFPNYTRIANDAGPMSSDFQKAFFAAWKSNAEYALNGLKPQPDAQVLVHMLRLWNKSHAGPAVPIPQSNASYLSTLVSQGVQSLQATDTGMTDGTNLLLNNGALLNPGATTTRTVLALRLSGGPVSATAPTGLSTGAKVAVGGAALGGAALLGAAAFAFAKGQAVDLVLKHAWKHVRSWF